MKIGIALGLSFFLTWVYFFTPQNFFSIDHKLRDFMFLTHGSLPKSDTVIIIDIDNKSLNEIGQWPWSRDIISTLIERLSQADAGIIGLDMVFSERDNSSPHLLHNKYPKISENLPNYDIVLANTLSKSPVVGGYIFTDKNTSETRSPLIPAIFIERGLRNTPYLNNLSGVILNIPIIQNAFYSSGFFSTQQNEGGVIRSVPIIQKYNGTIYPSLALEMLRRYYNINKVEVVGDSHGVEYIQLGDYQIPTESSGEFIINFRGPKNHFQYISASSIMKNKFNPKDIAHKFVLIGTSAPGLKDLRYIPFDSTFPGVEVHANVIDNILSGDFIKKPLISKLYDIIIIWIVVFGLMLLLHFITSWLIIPIASTLFILLIFSLYFILFHYGLILTILTPLLAFSMTLISSIIFDYLTISKQKEQIRRILGKKVSAPVMQQLLSHNDDELIQSKEVPATIFFSDIRDFTSISEKIGSPEKLIQLLNTYMTPMSTIIMEEKGTIDKFIGDSIMAYWNIPIHLSNHADFALTAAIRQIELLQNVNITLTRNYGLSINIGIGIHSGIVTAGEMGSVGRSDYTIIGDSVNLASRIEGLTRLYDAQILISEETRQQLTKSYSMRPIDTVQVKGKKQSTTIYEVFTSIRIPSVDELSTHQVALHLFQRNNVQKAHILFKELHKNYPSQLYAHFIERCEDYDPSKDFNPILKMFQK